MLIDYRMNITLARSVDTNCPPTTINMRAGRSERRRQKKRERELQMLFVAASICIFECHCIFLLSGSQLLSDV